METREIAHALGAKRSSIRNLHAPPAPGVYAIYLNKGMQMPELGHPPAGLIYVGSSRDLASREYDMHFSSKSTGFSTLRRSVGALLKDDLSLSAIARSSGSAASNYTCYRFTPHGEDRLTQWMEEHLQVAVCPVAGDYEAIEKDLIAHLQPVLCLTVWPNPLAPKIKELRRICADEARAH